VLDICITVLLILAQLLLAHHCEMISVLQVFLLLLFAHQCSCKSRADDPEYAQLDREVKSLRTLAYGLNGEESEDPMVWGQLAMMIQAKDVKFHEDSVRMQPEALNCFDKAIELANPATNVLMLTHRKGILLKMMSRGEDAIRAHEWVLERAVSPLDKAESLQNKGHALTMLGRVDEAIVVFREAVSIAPYSFGLYIAYVEVLLEKKAPEAELRELYERIEHNIEHFRLNQAAIRREIAMTRSALQISELSDDGPVYWALFLLGDKLKDYSRAWQYLDTAHHLVRHSRPLIHDLQKDVVQANQIEQIFRKEFFPDPQKSGVGMATTTPIFIVGMMRSGSTLTETMLDAHPEIFGMGEDSVFNAHLSDLRDGIVAASEEDQRDRQVNMEAGGVTMPATAKTVNKFGKLVTRKMLSLAKNATTASGKMAKEGEVKHVVDKMLFNYRNIGFIHLVFPNAVILHTMRDPMDTLYSCVKHKFDDSGLEWTLDPDQLAQQYALYLGIIAHFRKVLPGRVVDVRYEELIHRPEEVMRRVVDKIGDIQWDDSILSFHSSQRIVHTPSMSRKDYCCCLLAAAVLLVCVCVCLTLCCIVLCPWL
jgi:tetratricopeptide (TPR) repeat protein